MQATRIFALVCLMSLLSPVVEAKPFYKTKKFWSAVAVAAVTAVVVHEAHSGNRPPTQVNPGPPVHPSPIAK
jgi:hypothetical protein